MAAMDEFREEREAMKHAGWKEKLSYFWDYYKIHTIVIVAVLIFGVSYVHHLITATDPALEGIFLNTVGKDEGTTPKSLLYDFAEDAKIDTEKYHFSVRELRYIAAVDMDSNNIDTGVVTTTTETSQTIAAITAAQALDFITGPHSCMEELAYQQYFIDLREVLSKEQCAKYEPFFIYIDLAIVEKIRDANNALELDDSIVLPSGTEPDEMEKPVPVMIDMSHCKKLTDAFGYEPDMTAFGIVANTTRTENAVRFIDYVMK